MRLSVIPRNEGFFDLFEAAATNCAAAADALRKLLADFADPPGTYDRIRELEQAGDEVTRQIIRALNTSFVTPFDREDIHKLASGLDDILDGVEAVADLLVLHRIQEPLPEMVEQADVLARATAHTVEAVGHLRSMSGASDLLRQIHDLEDEGDRVYRKTLARLFSGDHDAMYVLRWKDLVDQMETAIDDCQAVANVIEAIVLKHA